MQSSRNFDIEFVPHPFRSVGKDFDILIRGEEDFSWKFSTLGKGI